MNLMPTEAYKDRTYDIYEIVLLKHEFFLTLSQLCSSPLSLSVVSNVFQQASGTVKYPPTASTPSAPSI